MSTVQQGGDGNDVTSRDQNVTFLGELWVVVPTVPIVTVTVSASDVTLNQNISEEKSNLEEVYCLHLHLSVFFFLSSRFIELCLKVKFVRFF